MQLLKRYSEISNKWQGTLLNASIIYNLGDYYFVQLRSPLLLVRISLGSRDFRSLKTPRRNRYKYFPWSFFILPSYELTTTLHLSMCRSKTFLLVIKNCFLFSSVYFKNFASPPPPRSLVTLE